MDVDKPNIDLHQGAEIGWRLEPFPVAPYAFPEPELVTATVRPGRYCAVSVCAHVTDLLHAGPLHCHLLVVGAGLLTATAQHARFDWLVERGVKSEGQRSVFQNRAAPVRRLDVPGDPAPLVATVDHRLREPISVRVLPFLVQDVAVPMTTGWLLWSLARAYEMIYEQHERYGVSGHKIDDLVFEGFTVSNNAVSVFMGS